MRIIAVITLYVAFLMGSAAAAQDSHRKVDQVFATYDKPHSAGCALGVIRDGAFIYRKAYGDASIELNVPMSPASIFYMGSVSKQFTATSVVLAAEQGLLSLDDDIRKYIPELPDYGHTITLRQMLHHTSGLKDFLTLFTYAGRDPAWVHSERENIDLIASQRSLNNIPGDEFIYSNTNYYLLGVVVERATGKSLEEFASENIFRPLGMEHTLYYDDHRVVLPGRVAAYDTGAGDKYLVDWSTTFDTVGAGGLMSNVDDLLLWDRNFYANRLGRGTLLKELQTRGVLNNGKPISYALGLELGSYRGKSIVEHDGALYGYRTEILRFPEQRFTVVCLCNVSSANPSRLARKVADIYLEKDLGAEPESNETSQSERFPDPGPFAGRYLDSRKHLVYSFTSKDGKLMAWGASLRPVGPNKFKDPATGTITFNGSAASMTATQEIDGDVFFAGQRIPEPHLTDTELAAYTGRFRSTEVDATYTLSVDRGSLVLRLNRGSSLRLNPVAPDEFENEELATIVFQRNASHQVSGLSLFSGRARNVVFEKVN